MSYLRNLSFIVLILSTCALANAQQSQPGDARKTVDDEVDVRLVELDVYVTDRQGHPLRGLDAGAFALEIDGQPAPIVSVESVSPTQGSPPSNVAETPLYVFVYVDRRFLDPGDLDSIRQDVESFLTAQLPAHARTMLVAAGSDFQVVAPMGDDPWQTVRGFHTLDGVAGSSRLINEYRLLLRQMQRSRLIAQERMEANDPVMGIGAKVRAEPKTFLSQIDAFDAQNVAATHAVASQLDRFVQMVSGLPGDKHLLYIGRRVSTNDSAFLFEAWQEAFANQSRDEPNRVANFANGSNRLDATVLEGLAASGRRESGDRVFEITARRAAAAGITIHAVDPGGQKRTRSLSQAPSDASIARSGKAASDGQTLRAGDALDNADALQILSGRTGGRYQSGTRNFTDAFAGIASDLQTHYRLAFAAPPPTEDDSEAGFGRGALHRVNVNVKTGQRRTQVRNAHLVRLQSLDERIAERTVAALALGNSATAHDLSALVGTPRPNGPEAGFAVSLEVGTPARDDADRLGVPVTVRVPVEHLALIADRQAHAGQLSIYATAGGLDAGLGPVAKFVLPVRIRNSDLLTSLGRHIDFPLHVELPSVGGTVAITVRDDYRPRVATVTAPVPTSDALIQSLSAPPTHQEDVEDAVAGSPR